MDPQINGAHGLWFEDLHPGSVIRHSVGRTVTEADNVFFTTLTMNPQPIHLDANYAATTEFRRPLVNSVFTLGLIVGLSVFDLTLGTIVANLGFSSATFPAPVFAGDTIYVETTVTSARGSKSRPESGIVEFRHVATNQSGATVGIVTRTALMMRRPSHGASSAGAVSGEIAGTPRPAGDR